MKKFYNNLNLIVLIFLTLSVIGLAQVPDFNWTLQAPGTGKDFGDAITVDHLGNIFVTGEFQKTIVFDTITVTSTTVTGTGDYDYFLAKYDSSHRVQWVKKGGGTLTDRGYGVTTDRAGNVLVTGHLFGTATFDGVSLTSAGNLDMFTAKYNANGQMQWIKQGSGVSQVSSRAIAVDTAGNVIVVGYFGSATAPTVTFGSIVLTTNGVRDPWIVKYDPAGNPLWAHNPGGLATGEEAKDVAVDVNGNIYVTGMFVDSASFGTQKIYSNGVADIFIAKYDKDGQIVWAKNAGGKKADEGSTIAVDNAGNIFVGGVFDSSATFGTTNIVGAGKNDAYVAKYDNSGNLLWVRYGGGVDDDLCNDIALDISGNVLGTGQFKVTATFGNFIITSAGNYDFFAFRMSAAGTIDWVQKAGGTDYDKGISAAVDNGGNLYATGYFKLTAAFGSTSLTASASEDIFITRIGNYKIPVELLSFEASNVNGKINLDWQTATELNNSGFEIQRSSDKLSFSKVAFIAGNGTTTEQKSYSFTDEIPLSGKSYYRLKQIDFDGTFAYSAVVEVESALPSNYFVSDNYPNPFNPSTSIRIDLMVQSNVTLSLFNSLGEVVSAYNSKDYAAGSHILNIDGSNLASGVYYYAVNIRGSNGITKFKTSKMVLLK